LRFKQQNWVQYRGYAIEIVKVPPIAESIVEGEVLTILKNVGERVEVDDIVYNLETEKATVDVRTPHAGVVKELFAQLGEKVQVGGQLFTVDTSAAGTATPPEQKKAEAPAKPQEAPKAEAPKQAEQPKKQETKAHEPVKQPPSSAEAKGPRERRVKLPRIRRRIAERLKDAQNTYALLTTFQEADMTAVMEMRNKYKDEFQKAHGVKLGFMSAFVKASAYALSRSPEVNGVMDGEDIIYRDYIDISVAVAGPKGLIVPVIRDADKLSFSQIEQAIIEFGQKAKNLTISPEDMIGGTFTISNGGVYGSMMGTPIVNPPQSAILGMHNIIQRPIVIDGKVEIRPMMYLALTYDHRIIDGKDAVTFLRTIKLAVEDPARMLLDI